ncbi:MAG: MATE family efflux transporter [Oscillospiraceae bacterium]|nr:MATE family efflux transporter [Oscillospiraceae bacterium]
MQLSLTEGKISSLLMRFSLPFLLASLIHMAYQMVDIVILGWFASPSSLAGAGNGANLIITVTGFFFGLTTGGMILLGQFYGAKDDESSAKTVGNIIVLQTTVAVISAVLVLSLGRLFINMINVPLEPDENGLTAAAEAWEYMRICACGLIFQAGYSTISSMLRALGNSKTPLVFVICACVMNIILDLVFVGVLGKGAFGAALATIIAQAFSFAISLRYLIRNKLPFPFSFKNIRPAAQTLKTILRLGIPISLQTVLNTLSFMVIAAIINNMGLYASSANGIVNNVVNIFMIIPMALGSSLSAISAQNLGAGKTHRAFESAKLGVVFSLIIAVPATVCASLFPTAIISAFTPHPDVIKASAEFLIPFSWDFLLVSFVFCINGFFNGCGITTFVALHETVAAFAVRIPVSWALSLISGATLYHVGIGTPVASLASLAMCLIYYKVKLSGGKLAQLRIAGAEG